jgi:hypothetical protein
MREDHLTAQQSALSSQSILALTSKKLEKMEWIKKVLDTESKFLDEERRWVEKEKNMILDLKSMSKNPLMASYNSEFEFGDRGHKRGESEMGRRKDRLEVEIEVLEKLNQEVQLELDRINEEKIALIDKEEGLQKEKLKLLLQFDQIKRLEIFYNEYHPVDKQITIEGTEVDHENMRELFQKYLQVSNKKNIKFYDTKDRS